MNRKGERKRQARKLKTTEEGKCKTDTQSRVTCTISISKERKGKERRERREGEEGRIGISTDNHNDQTNRLLYFSPLP
jgi:hypothetical protein